MLYRPTARQDDHSQCMFQTKYIKHCTHYKHNYTHAFPNTYPNLIFHFVSVVGDLVMGAMSSAGMLDSKDAGIYSLITSVPSTFLPSGEFVT